MVGLALYRGIATAAEPLIRHYVGRRLRRGKEDPNRLAERFGQPSRDRPPGPLVWIHAASVGESLSMLPVIDRLRTRAGLSVLMTSGTVTSARLLAQRLPKGVIHQFVPIDRPGWVRRFLDYWQPGLVLWVESELWPTTLCELALRRIPTILVNARLSAHSFGNWQYLPGASRKMLSAFDLCLAQTEVDADRLRRLGAPTVRTAGNLKNAAPPLPADSQALTALRRATRGRNIWLAASTHPGEEDMAASAHATVRRTYQDALLVIVPRHPERGPQIAGTLASAGHDVRLGSARAVPDGSIFIADGLGELGLFFRLAEAAFMGGSLVPHGGQNLLEPARLDCAIIHGPHMTNFAEMAAEMAAAGGVVVVGAADKLAGAVCTLFEDSPRRSRQIEAAAAFAVSKADVLDRVTGEIEPFLGALTAGHAPA